MRVLLIHSGNKVSISSNYTFVKEQGDALRKQGVEVSYYAVNGKGIRGYLSNLCKIKKTIESYKPDIIHAHFGLCGLLANLQRKVPVITTYHGSDINVPRVLRFSKISIWLSSHNIFVNKKNLHLALGKNNNKQGSAMHYTLLPCGITMTEFPMCTYQEARKKLGWGNEKKILFASSFTNVVKNASLAQAAVQLVSGVELIELKGFNRAQVASILCAVDAFLMTSHTEGSPQVVKEAMACGCPIVSVDVGDVAERISGVEKCYIAERTPEDIAAKLQLVLQDTKRTNGRQHILDMKLDNESTAKKLIEIYNTVINK